MASSPPETGPDPGAERAVGPQLRSTLGFSCRWFLYLVFVFLLGAACTRDALRYDFLIAEKVGEPSLPLALSFAPTCTWPPPPCSPAWESGLLGLGLQ